MRIFGRRRSAITSIGGGAAMILLLLGLAACGATTAPARPTPTRPLATATPAPPTWTIVTNTPSSTISLKFASSNPSVAYLCAIDGPAAAPLTATARLYKSVDSGQSWQRVNTAPTLHPVPPAVSGGPPLAGCRVFVDASDATDVFLQQTEIEPVGASFAIARALWRSRDGGQTWQQIAALDSTDGFDDLAVLGARLIARPHPSVYGAGRCDPSVPPKAYSFVMGSDDGGVTWHDIGQGIESQGYSPHDFAVEGDSLFAAADKVPATACSAAPIVSALWKSSDAGNSWAKVTAPAIEIGTPSFTPKGAGSGYYGVAWASPDVSSGVFTPLYSSDSGATWVALPAAPTLNPGYGQPVVAPSGAVLVDGDGGLNNNNVYVLRPSDATPAWSVYAPGSSGQWQVVSGPGGATLWSVSFTYGGPSVVEHLPLP